MKNELQISNPLSAAMLFIIFIIIQLPNLTGLSMTVDDQDAIFRTWPAVWLQQGRWGAYIVERYILQTPIIPFMPLALLGACQVASFALICRIIGTNALGWGLIAAFAYFVASPQWIFSIEFGPNNTAMGLGLLAATLSAFGFSIMCRPGATVGLTVRVALFSAACLCATVGLYQAYFVVGIVLSSAAIVFHYIGGKVGIRRLIALHAVLLVAGAVGFVASAVIERIANWFYRIERVDFYADGFISLSSFLSNPLAGPKMAWDTYLAVVWGYPGTYYVSTWAFGLALLAASALVIVAAFRRGALSGLLALLWVLLANLAIVAFPFAAAGQYIPYRVMAVMPALSAFLLVASLIIFSGVVRVALVSLAAFAAFQGTIVFDRAAAASILMSQKDAYIAGDLFRRTAEIGVRGDYGLYKIELSGRIPSQSPYPMPVSSHMALSWFDQLPYAFRASEYMRSLGYPVTAERRIDGFPEEFAAMPSWPAEGSTRLVGDTVLIKLSD